MNHRRAYAMFGYWCLLLLAGCAVSPATPTPPRVTSVPTHPPANDTAIAQRATGVAPSQAAAAALPPSPTTAIATRAVTITPTPARAAVIPVATPIPVAATKIGTVSGSIEHAQISPDNRYVVYLQERSLYSLSLARGSPHLIAKELVPSLFTLSISRDSRSITYQDQDALYRAPIAGGQRVRLTSADTHISGSRVFSQNGRSVVYCNDGEASTALYRASLDGSPPIQLSSGSLMCDFRLTPDSRFVIYRVSAQNDQRPHVPSWPGVAYTGLYSVPLAGGTPTQLNAPLADTDDITEYRISPDGATVVYRAGSKLYRALTTGGAPAELGPALSDEFAFSPDGQHLIYRSANRLYSLPSAGGAPIQLADSLDAIAPVYLQITADSRFVVYATIENQAGAAGHYDIYSAPLAGGTPIKLAASAVLLDTGYVLVNPDNQSALVIVAEPDGTYSMRSTSLATGSSVQLGQFVAGRLPGDYTLLPNSRFVLYRQAQEGLFAMPLDGGTSRKLAPAQASIVAYTVSPDQSQIVYVADPVLDDDPTLEVYLVSTSALSA